MNNYEVMYVIDTALEDQARIDVINRFSGIIENNGGKVERVDEWGKRRLAYPINYKTEGYYVLLYMSAPAELPRELERNFKISDAILRYLVTRIDGEIPTKREPIKTYAPREQVEAKTEAPVAEKAEPAAVEATEAPAEAAADSEAPVAEVE